MKGNVDFGSKLTLLCFLKVFDETIDKWDYTYGDVVKHELLQSGSDFTVKSSVNGSPLSLGGSSGDMPLDDFNDFIIEKMYYGSIADCQKESGAENPESNLTRDDADTETNIQWWSKQKKYEDRVLLKNTLDTTPLELHTLDKSAGAPDSSREEQSITVDEVDRDPSSSSISIGSTSEKQSDSAISTDLTLGASDSITNSKDLQYNTLDTAGTFERTQSEPFSVAHGEQVSLGLDNLQTIEVQHNLFEPIDFPTSESTPIEFAPTHAVALDGSDQIQTSGSNHGKALQLNHYVPIEVEREKATVNQENTISLLGANDIPDNHVYSE